MNWIVLLLLSRFRPFQTNNKVPKESETNCGNYIFDLADIQSSLVLSDLFSMLGNTVI